MTDWFQSEAAYFQMNDFDLLQTANNDYEILPNKNINNSYVQ